MQLQQRATAVDERIQRLAQKTSLVTSTVIKVWESALQAPPAELVTWFHGDLHPQNVLVEDGELTGVIDWADIAAGDSATDLASIWMLLPTVAARETAIAEYGSVSPATWSRALGWAIKRPSAVVLFLRWYYAAFCNLLFWLLDTTWDASSFLTIGATRVPRSSIACIAFRWGIIPPLRRMVIRLMPPSTSFS